MKCYWHRLQMELALDDQRPPSSATRHHLESCTDCQAFHQRQLELQARLMQPESGAADPSPFLRRRILREIAAPADTSPNPAWLHWLGPTAVACLMIALLVVTNGPRSNDLPNTGSIAGAASLQDEWVTLTSEMTSGGTVFRAITNFDRPLQNELQLVLKDAQSALHTLTEEFVPPMMLTSSD